MKYLYAFLICYLLAFEIVFSADTWNYFTTVGSFDGKICNDSDLVFRKVLVRGKLACLIECMNHADCVSVFLHSDGLCAACGVTYNILFNPLQTMEGTKYFEKQIILYNGGYINSLVCPLGWIKFDTSCYYLVEDALNFEKGVDRCQQMNAHAVKINDESENINIQQFLLSLTFDATEWGFFTAYKNDSSSWTSYDSSHTITFDNWIPNEPSYDFSENCLVYFVQMDLKWMDSPCSENLRMICEFD